MLLADPSASRSECVGGEVMRYTVIGALEGHWTVYDERTEQEWRFSTEEKAIASPNAWPTTVLLRSLRSRLSRSSRFSSRRLWLVEVGAIERLFERVDLCRCIRPAAICIGCHLPN